MAGVRIRRRWMRRSSLLFARSLPSGEVHSLIRDAGPAKPIVGYRRTENCWRHYEHLRGMPSGFLVCGDAVCAFNPVYGQGITVAALQAVALDAALHKGADPAAAFDIQREFARIIPIPWALATGEDMRYPGMTSRPSPGEKCCSGMCSA
jgi:2-polyprenyl-6-methoxyphenol hydroxylase-like FAD-dependent oxidoreductase